MHFCDTKTHSWNAETNNGNAAMQYCDSPDITNILSRCGNIPNSLFSRQSINSDVIATLRSSASVVYPVYLNAGGLLSKSFTFTVTSLELFRPPGSCQRAKLKTKHSCMIDIFKFKIQKCYSTFWMYCFVKFKGRLHAIPITYVYCSSPLTRQ